MLFGTTSKVWYDELFLGNVVMDGGPGTEHTVEDKILELLGAGLGPAVVASTLGITESRISQLLAQEAFATKVIAARLARVKGTVDRDNKWDKIEDALLEKLENIIVFIADPMKIIRMLQVVNAAKRRGAGAMEGQGAASAGTIVQITGPARVLMQFITNGNNEVIDVNGRSLVPMQSKAVMEQLKSRQMQLAVEKGDGNVGNEAARAILAPSAELSALQQAREAA